MEQNEAAGTSLAASTERMATAAEQLHALLEKMGQQMEALTRKVDRIVAAIDEAAGAPPLAGAVVGLAGADTAEGAEAAAPGAGVTPGGAMPEAKRVHELEKQNAELKVAAQRARRKTLSGATLALLAKSGADDGQAIEAGALEQALRSLSVEQRIAVKAEMARAGLL
jgi:cell division septum initiation protein DivIVA